MSQRIECPCNSFERPMCGVADCWHHTTGVDNDCALCHRTGFVQAGTAKKLIRARKRLSDGALETLGDP